MLGLWKAHRGRRAAVATIVPFLDGTRHRMGGIPEWAWRDPYVIGFLCMLITVIATRTTGSLRADVLAAVQAAAWTDVTGRQGDLIGEEICFLGAAHDDKFLFGCRNAEAFVLDLNVATRDSEESVRESQGFPATPENSAARVGAALWSRYFDAYLGGPLTAQGWSRSALGPAD